MLRRSKREGGSHPVLPRRLPTVRVRAERPLPEANTSGPGRCTGYRPLAGSMSTQPIGAVGAAGAPTSEVLAQQDQVIRQQARSRVQKLAPGKTALAVGAITSPRTSPRRTVRLAPSGAPGEQAHWLAVHRVTYSYIAGPEP